MQNIISVILLRASLLSVIFPNAIMLNAVAPLVTGNIPRDRKYRKSNKLAILIILATT
jgi:hypothetical protein